MKILFGIATLCEIIFAQNKIPFASQNNTIELFVANTATVDVANVTVEVQNAPQWLTFTNLKTQISNLKSREASTTSFTFSVDKSAPVGKEQKLQFVITSPTGERWTKEIAIQVSPPEKFELFQNYPNPFNPTTTIGYQLPMSSTVSLQIFDAIGREVATLDEGIKEAGYHQKEWNARLNGAVGQAVNVASGFYVYQLSYKNEKGEQKFYRKKLLLLK